MSHMPQREGDWDTDSEGEQEKKTTANKSVEKAAYVIPSGILFWEALILN